MRQMTRPHFFCVFTSGMMTHAHFPVIRTNNLLEIILLEIQRFNVLIFAK